MAGKVQPAKLKTFFEGHRRKCFLVQWIQHCNRAGVSTIKMDMRLPLLGPVLIGMNQEIGEPFSLMAKLDSKTERSAINVEIEGMSLDIFSTDSSKDHWVSTTGAKLMKLYLATVGEGEKKEVNLHMAVYVPFTKEMMEWAAIHLHKDFYIETVYSNSESKLAFATADETELEDDDSDESPAEGGEDGEEDLDQDNEENAPAAAQDEIPFDTPAPATAKPVPMPKRKNGPKELAAFHSTQVN
jgi:hypothetical protein